MCLDTVEEYVCLECTPGDLLGRLSQRVRASGELNPVSPLDALVNHNSEYERHIALIRLSFDKTYIGNRKAIIESTLQPRYQRWHGHVYLDKIPRCPEVIAHDTGQS